MDYFFISLVAFLGSALTLFSGFGLGTILLPVFVLFFPVEVAILLTAIVHFLNNIFKLLLLGKFADKKIVFNFGIPAVIAAFFGAFLLGFLTDLKPLFHYSIRNYNFEIMPIKLIIALILICFVIFDIVPKFSKFEFDKKYLTIGGLLSGFFGGISGNQGALRTAFLTKLNLEKQVFIATGVLIACLIDSIRLSIYFNSIQKSTFNLDLNLILLAILSAFAGAFLGNKFLKKVSNDSIKIIVGFLLLLFSIFLGLGLI